MTRLDEKLARIRAGADKRTDFIIADAKDAEMGPGLHGVGLARLPDGSWSSRLKTRHEYLEAIEAVVRQDVVDIMLTSVGNLEKLVERNAFSASQVKPAIRANDTTDVWRLRGATYHHRASRPFRTASLARVKALTDLGLYSITFNNDLDADCATLEAFQAFRQDAAGHGFSYFLEVFNPNVDANLDSEAVAGFVNDAIIRCLAGLTEAERPRFLKIVYTGPKALDELVTFDPSLIVGVLGRDGTTRDCFELIHQAQKYGAKVALFGRKINGAEAPLEIVRMMRAVSDGALTPCEAVEDYHDALRRKGLRPLRDFAEDREITEAALMQA